MTILSDEQKIEILVEVLPFIRQTNERVAFLEYRLAELEDERGTR